MFILLAFHVLIIAVFVIDGAAGETSTSTSSAFIIQSGQGGGRVWLSSSLKKSSNNAKTTSTTTTINLIDPASVVGLDPELVREMEGARVAFWLCFFGASGSAAM